LTDPDCALAEIVRARATLSIKKHMEKETMRIQHLAQMGESQDLKHGVFDHLSGKFYIKAAAE